MTKADYYNSEPRSFWELLEVGRLSGKRPQSYISIANHTDMGPIGPGSMVIRIYYDGIVILRFCLDGRIRVAYPHTHTKTVLERYNRYLPAPWRMEFRDKKVRETNKNIFLSEIRDDKKVWEKKITCNVWLIPGVRGAPHRL